MSFRIVLDECHNNNLDFLNSEAFQVMLNRLDGVLFRLIQPPIKYENIEGEDLIILGCPTTKYSSSEIDALEKFIEKGNGMILISGNGGDLFYNTNLNEIGRKYEFEFNDDQIEDESYNLGLSNVIKVSQFDTVHFSNNVKFIIYSGCSINILDESCKIIARSNPGSNPPNAPVAVISPNNQVIGIGAFNLFIDHPEFGIERAQNLQFVLTIFDFLKNQIEMTKEGKKEMVPIGKISMENKQEVQNNTFKSYEFQISKPEKETELKIDINKFSPKQANKKFEEFSTFYIEKLDAITEQMDEFWLFIKKTISESKEANLYEKIEKQISSKHQEFLELIGKLAKKIDEVFSTFCSNFSEADFDSNKALNDWFENEASCREKLDMIRNNLMAMLNSLK